MKKLLTVCVLLAALCLMAMVLFPQLSPFGGVRVDDSLSAAALLRSALAQGEDSILVRADNVQPDEVFHALEATYPYAFTLHSVRRPTGTMTLRVEIENKAGQEQGAVLAQGIVKSLITDEMSLRDRLRILHDYVVKNCVYDVATADLENVLEGSGSDAPFTAVGALVDGTAVCAGYARAYMMLCQAAGLDLIYVTDESMNHGWNAVRLYGETFYIDPTFDDPIPDQGAVIETRYFLKTAEELSETHTWNRAFYDRLLDSLTPSSQDAAQRLFDLGVVTVPPRAATLSAPLPETERRRLENATGLTFPAASSYGAACQQIWNAILEDGLAARLIQADLMTAIDAKLAGVPESALPAA